MNFKSRIAITIGKLTSWFLKTFTSGGSSLPGKLALTIDPDLLNHLSTKYEIIVITGTNGKTLTTALCVEIMKTHGLDVITNSSGSNMQQGIVSTFIQAPHINSNKRNLAILEVDEGSLKHVITRLKPKILVMTNVFEDQLDRYGSIKDILNLLIDAAKSVPQMTVIANGDLPLFNTMDLPNPIKFFGFNTSTNQDQYSASCPICHTILEYSARTYADLGDYSCPQCNLKRPSLTCSVDSIESLDINSSHFTIDGYAFTLPVAGIYNIYNALAAYTVAKTFNIPIQSISKAFDSMERVQGRQETFDINHHSVLMNLVKNPVGMNQVIDLIRLENEPTTLVAIFNNHHADGTDISWINEAKFEQLHKLDIQNIIIGGLCYSELKERFLKAGFNKNQIQVINNYEEIIHSLEKTNSSKIHILASYTAMNEFRELLDNKNYL